MRQLVTRSLVALAAGAALVLVPASTAYAQPATNPLLGDNEESILTLPGLAAYDNANNWAQWMDQIDYEDGDCVRFPVGGQTYTMPGYPGQFEDWVLAIVKSVGADPAPASNDLTWWPIAGEVFWHTSGQDIAHVILCSADFSDDDGVVPPPPTTTTSPPVTPTTPPATTTTPPVTTTETTPPATTTTETTPPATETTPPTTETTPPATETTPPATTTTETTPPATTTSATTPPPTTTITPPVTTTAPTSPVTTSPATPPVVTTGPPGTTRTTGPAVRTMTTTTMTTTRLVTGPVVETDRPGSGDPARTFLVMGGTALILTGAGLALSRRREQAEH